MSKPWHGEFPVDRDMDDAAVRILLKNMRAGREFAACGAVCTATVPAERHAGAAPIGAVCVLAAGEHAGGWHLDANGHRFARKE